MVLRGQYEELRGYEADPRGLLCASISSLKNDAGVTGRAGCWFRPEGLRAEALDRRFGPLRCSSRGVRRSVRLLLDELEGLG